MTRIPGPLAAPPARTWTLGTAPWQAIPPASAPRARVIIDNDFSGDPDDLIQLVHHLLSPSVGHPPCRRLPPPRGRPLRPERCDRRERARGRRGDVARRMGLTDEVIRAGANRALDDATTPAVGRRRRDHRRGPARRPDDAAVLRRRRRPDRSGLGVPRRAAVAKRMTLVWIGGNEHEGLAVPPPNAMPIEYNLLIDVVAAQVLFNDWPVTIWQVPRDVYRQCLVSDAELRLRVAATGSLGVWMYAEVAQVFDMVATHLGRPGETYAMGDSPLVLLTALPVGVRTRSLIQSLCRAVPPPRDRRRRRHTADVDGARADARLHLGGHPPHVRGLLPQARGVRAAGTTAGGCRGGGLVHARAAASLVSTIPRPRTIVTADPELDDLNSMIRFLLYANEVEIEGLIYASSRFHWRGTDRVRKFFLPQREYDLPQTSWRWAPGSGSSTTRSTPTPQSTTTSSCTTPATPPPTRCALSSARATWTSKATPRASRRARNSSRTSCWTTCPGRSSCRCGQGRARSPAPSCRSRSDSAGRTRTEFTPKSRPRRSSRSSRHRMTPTTTTSPPTGRASGSSRSRLSRGATWPDAPFARRTCTC